MAPLFIWALATVLGGTSVLAAPVLDGTISSGYDYVSQPERA
jgi:hypothetical protein